MIAFELAFVLPLNYFTFFMPLDEIYALSLIIVIDPQTSLFYTLNGTTTVLLARHALWEVHLILTFSVHFVYVVVLTKIFIYISDGWTDAFNRQV